MLDLKKIKTKKKTEGGVLLDCNRLSNKELSRRHFIKTERLMECICKSFEGFFWAFKQLIFVFV